MRIEIAFVIYFDSLFRIPTANWMLEDLFIAWLDYMPVRNDIYELLTLKVKKIKWKMSQCFTLLVRQKAR